MNLFRNILRVSAVAILLAIVCPADATAGSQQPVRDYATISAKAGRFFKYREWANAAAMYELMIEDSASVPMNYANAIVVAGMRNLPDYQMSVFERSQSNLVPMAQVLQGVRQVSFSLGEAGLYERFLHLLLERQPWLGRSIDRQLLDYYLFRRDADGIVRMSRLMLSTAPDNTNYLNSLADGLILQSKYEESADVYRKILVLEPNNLTALLALGNYLFINKQPDEALPYLSQANRIAPSPDLAEKIKQCRADSRP